MRHVSIAVIGGGISGRLVQHAIPEAEIYDWNRNPTASAHVDRLSRDFGANYLWEPIPGIECDEFQVVTHIDHLPPTLQRVIAYKEKIHKSGDVDDWEQQFRLFMHGYNFKELPAFNVKYAHRVTSVDRMRKLITFEAGLPPVRYDRLVSTIPLPALLKLIGMPLPEGGLSAKPIYVKVTPRPPDAPFPPEVIYVNYLSHPTVAPYRFCDRNGERHYESIVPFPGLSTRVIKPGKLYPNPHVPEFLDVLQANDIYTFGRGGSWAPDELVHQTWNRIVAWREAICGLI